MLYIQNMESITSFGHKWIILSYLNGEQRSVQREKAKREINCLTSIARVCLVLQ